MESDKPIKAKNSYDPPGPHQKVELADWGVDHMEVTWQKGEYEPLDRPADAILIKDPFDPTSPPGLPEITNWTENSVIIKWAPPLRENGAPVTSYTIEFREAEEDDWTTGPKVKAKNFPDGEVPNLTPGKKYEFRVRAENKAGLGEPSEHTNPHLMKARFAPPKIDRTNLDTKVVKVNQQVFIEVDVTGEPAPETTWTIEGKPIKTEGKHLFLEFLNAWIMSFRQGVK